MIDLGLIQLEMSELVRSLRASEEGVTPTPAAAGGPAAEPDFEHIVGELYAYHVKNQGEYAERAKNIRDAVTARNATDTAAGILMQRHGIDLPAALGILDLLTDRIMAGSAADGVIESQIDESRLHIGSAVGLGEHRTADTSPTGA